MTEKFNVGYIGLGSIGKPIAKHLVCDQFNAHVYDIHRPAVAELAALGARGCDSPAQLARACAHIGICVLEASQVEAVLYGADGLLENAASGAIIAIHSTVTRADVLKWAGAGAARGIKVIDAPITGGVRSAEAASLCYMVGGDSATFATASRVFETSAEKIIHTGELGTGIILKLCNNLITNAEFMAMSEATRLAEAGGLSAELLREVGKSNGVINETMYNFINNRNALAATCSAARMEEIFGPPGKLGEKDLLCAIQSARELGVELPYTQRLQGDIYNLFLNKV
ncbi:MAG: NAD(P)-dependent oxidoreductase [Halieaceae bacterium]|nr:NAD(P)-dependent oxidoreductase [Halieaceae bacterium]